VWAVARWAEGRPTVRFVGCRHAAQEVDWANPEEPHAPGVPVPTRKPSVARTARPTASPSVAPTLAWPTNAPVDYDTHSPSENTSTAAARLERDKERYEKHAAQEPDWVRPGKPRSARVADQVRETELEQTVPQSAASLHYAAWVQSLPPARPAGASCQATADCEVHLTCCRWDSEKRKFMDEGVCGSACAVPQEERIPRPPRQALPFEPPY